MNLKDYKTEILSIAEVNGATEDVARDMFVANVRKGAPVMGEPWYEGASHVDYEALKAQWDGLSEEGRAQAMLDYLS